MVIKSLAQTLKDLATGIKNTITGVTGSNATLTIIKGNGTTSTVTVNNVANATKATQDSAGQQINTTYIKGLSISGKTITYTKGDGTTGTITTQDTTYTHPNSGVTAGTYKSVTVNAQGHVTAGSNPTTLAGYGITDASLKDHTHSQYLTASSDLNVNKLKGVISLDNLPAGALERLVKVTNDTARFALTTNDIQLGDTVKVESTKMMYIVKDITKLNSEDGYEKYTSGMASSVPWSGVTGKPSSYTPSTHTHDDRYYTESEINSKVNTINSSIDTKADKTHTHDDRYYTESEIDSKLSTKSPLIGSTSLSKLSSNVTFGDGGAFSITQNDGSWWQRLRTNDNNDKTQKRLIYEESQGNSGSSYTELFSVDGNGNIYAGGTLLSKNGHTHDDRYYTESEMNTKLAGKSDTTHTHDNRYYTESEIDSKVNTINTSINNKSDKTHTHDDRYYTESEINTKLSGKSDTSHTHNYLPLAGGTTTGKVNMKSANLDNLPQIFRTDGVNFAGIRFQNTNGYLGAIGITGNVNSVAQRLGSDGNLYPILDSSNYNNYSPTKTGDGASGTWDINVSGNSATATKATQDSAGQQINTTYIKGLSVSGKTITYTKGNGSTGTITTQDTAYSHPNSGVSAGTYRNVTVNAQGHVTAGSNPTTLSGYGITDAPTKTGGGASGTWGINISGNAVNDGNGANIANTYLKKSGGNVTGPLNFANGTWNLVGDDSYMGDHNISGTFCIKGANGATGIALVNINNESDYAHISYNGGNINFNKKITANLAGNADTATHASSADSATKANTATLISGFANIDNGTWGHSTGTFITGFQEKGGGSIQWRAEDGRLYERVDGTFWQREGTYEVIDTSTVNNYAPTKTGGGASGTWGINISGNSATATKAAQDSAGQQINTTYIKGLSVSGKTITYTKGNGTTGTITTQDTVYTLPAASSSTLGGIKMSYGTNDLSAGSSSLATGALYFVYE